MGRKKTYSEFSKQLKSKNDHIVLAENYITADTKSSFKCLKCGRFFITTPHSILRGNSKGCPECDRKRVRLSHESFVARLKEINPNIEVLSKFTRQGSYISCRCLNDNHEWKALGENLLNGHGCQKCATRRNAELARLTTEEFLQKFNNVKSQDVTLLTHFSGRDDNMKCKCNECGEIWETRASNLLSGKGCPNFRKHRDYKTYNQLSHEEFVDRIKCQNSDIEILGVYVDKNTKIRCFCKRCNSTWDAAPSNLMSGTGCPHCKKSKGEEYISQILMKYNIKFYNQYRFDDCKDVRSLPFDFYLPNNNKCIEFDGEQHFRPVTFGGMSYEQAEAQMKYIQYHDEIKNSYCKEHGIDLIRIPYTKLNQAENIISKIVA